jgi:hypothetical protein
VAAHHRVCIRSTPVAQRRDRWHRKNRPCRGAGDPVPPPRQVGIRNAGRRKLSAIATTHAPRVGAKLADQLWAALDEQTVTVLPRLAYSLKTVLQQRKQVPSEEILDAHPLAGGLTSMPGIGVRFAALSDPECGRC